MMEPLMIIDGADKKIGILVIGLIHIPMMNTLAFLQSSAKYLFGFENVDTRSSPPLLYINGNVAARLFGSIKFYTLFHPAAFGKEIRGYSAISRAKASSIRGSCIKLFTASLAKMLHLSLSMLHCVGVAIRTSWRNNNAAVRASFPVLQGLLSTSTSRAAPAVSNHCFFCVAVFT
jgi:hypothetical protein